MDFFKIIYNLMHGEYILEEYRVPLFLLTQERSLGPKPTENSTTVTPFKFCKKKMPELNETVQ